MLVLVFPLGEYLTLTLTTLPKPNPNLRRYRLESTTTVNAHSGSSSEPIFSTDGLVQPKYSKYAVKIYDTKNLFHLTQEAPICTSVHELWQLWSETDENHAWIWLGSMHYMPEHISGVDLSQDQN